MIRDVKKRLLAGILKVIAGLALALFLFTHQARDPDATDSPVIEIDPGNSEQP